jgi:sugar phosphate isomerase/epimerase
MFPGPLHRAEKIKRMNILFFCTRWGFEHIPWNEFLLHVKNAGYDGVETSFTFDEKENEEIVTKAERYNLKVIAQQWDTVEPDFKKHKKEYEKRLQLMANLQPLLITSHTGKDYYTYEQNCELLNLAQDISLSSGIQIIHETHRGKFSFAAHATRSYLEGLPWLRLTLDVSHWCTVAESYLADQPAALQLALERTRHIHARVGFMEGPQITDLRHPVWSDAFSFHLSCWDRVINLRRKEANNGLTITTEFGPFPYLSLQQHTESSIGHWELNCDMKDMLKVRYSFTE